MATTAVPTGAAHRGSSPARLTLDAAQPPAQLAQVDGCGFFPCEEPRVGKRVEALDGRALRLQVVGSCKQRLQAVQLYGATGCAIERTMQRKPGGSTVWVLVTQLAKRCGERRGAMAPRALCESHRQPEACRRDECDAPVAQSSQGNSRVRWGYDPVCAQLLQSALTEGVSR